MEDKSVLDQRSGLRRLRPSLQVFTAYVEQYLNAAYLLDTNSPPATAESIAECFDRKMQLAADVRQIGKPLAEQMEECGIDSTSVCHVVSRLVIGGHSANLGSEWPKIRGELNRLIIKCKIAGQQNPLATADACAADAILCDECSVKVLRFVTENRDDLYTRIEHWTCPCPDRKKVALDKQTYGQTAVAKLISVHPATVGRCPEYWKHIGVHLYPKSKGAKNFRELDRTADTLSDMLMQRVPSLRTAAGRGDK